MKHSTTIARRISLLVLLSLVSAIMPSFFAVSAVSAARGLTVTGVLLVTDVKPGETLNHKMTVSIGDGDAATEIGVTVAEVGQAEDGTYIVLSAAEESSVYSARSLITVDRSSFPLQSGQTQTVTATAKIPSSIGEGGRYAIISIQTKPVGQPGVGIASAVNVPVYLTVANTNLVHKGEITGISVGEPSAGKPIEVLTSFRNMGNHHFKVKGEVTVSDPNGKTLDTIHVAPTGTSIIPTMTRRLNATFIPRGVLPAGKYSVKSKVMLEDGAILDEHTGVFEIKQTYVPPPAAAETVLRPLAAATLKTDDGRISVTFPQGAAVGEAHLGLRSYSRDLLPSAPEHLKLAATFFRVDGLNGLLAKQATVAVKCSPADMEAAEGDASRLVLARWDESDQRWYVIRTAVDTRTMALSARTDQLGIWAVMVKDSPSSRVPWAGLSVLAVVAVVCLGIVLFVSVRRRKD